MTPPSREGIGESRWNRGVIEESGIRYWELGDLNGIGNNRIIEGNEPERGANLTRKVMRDEVQSIE